MLVDDGLSYVGENRVLLRRWKNHLKKRCDSYAGQWWTKDYNRHFHLHSSALDPTLSKNPGQPLAAHSKCGQCWLKIHNTARYSLNSNRRSTRTDTLIQTAKKDSSHVFFVNLTTYKNRIKISKLDQKISFSEIFAVINSFSVVLFLSFSRVRTARLDKLNSNRSIVFQKKMFDKLLIFK